MQQLELVPYLLIAVVFSVLAMYLIVRSWYKTRLMPTLLYSVAIGCFSGMALDLLLDQVFVPFREWYIDVNGQVMWMSNLLLSFFVVGGFLCWYFAIIYSQYDSPPRTAFFVLFIAGAALLGEIEKMTWSETLPLAIEAVAFAILILEIMKYARRVLRSIFIPEQRAQARLYFAGFLVWIIAGPLGIVIANVEGLEWIGTAWVIPYSLGLLMISIAVARNPRLLFISEARPHDLLILDRQGMLIFTYRFFDYRSSIDPELMGSAMSGVISLMREMLASAKELHRIDHGDVRILVECGPLTTFLLVVEKETVRFRQSLRHLLMEFETGYREELASDTSMTSAFTDFKWRVRETFL